MIGMTALNLKMRRYKKYDNKKVRTLQHGPGLPRTSAKNQKKAPAGAGASDYLNMLPVD